MKSSRPQFAELLKYIYGAVFLVPLVWNPLGSVNPYELAKHSFLIFVISVFLILGAVHIFFVKKTVFSLNKKIIFVLGLWGLSFALSTIFSMVPVESFWGSYERLQGFASAVFYGIHFLVCLWIFEDEKMRRRFILFTLIVGALVSLYGILQKLGVDFVAAEAKGMFAGRSFATLGSPTGFGQFLIWPVFAAIFFFFREWKRNRSRGIFIFVVGLLALIALWFSKNRASMLGVLLSLFFVLLAILPGFRKKIMVGLTGILLGGILIFFFSSDVRSLGTRALLWQGSSHIASGSPFFGSGPETYYQTVQTVITPQLYEYERMTDIPDRSHNAFLDALLTRGIFGFALWLLQIGILIWIFLRRFSQKPEIRFALGGIMALILSLQFGFFNVTDILFWLAAWALLLRGTFSFKKITIDFSRFVLRFLSMMVVFVIAVFGVRHAYGLVRTDILFGKAIGSFLTAESGSVENFDRAIASSPQYGYFYRSLFILLSGDMKENLELLPRMKFYADRLARITNQSFHAELAYAKIALAEKNPAVAQKRFEAAAKKAPNWPTLWMEWGELLFKDGDYAGAAEKFERLLELAPSYWNLNVETAPFEEREKLRIFRNSNQRFYEALAMLIDIYNRLGNPGRARELQRYL